MEQIAMLGGLGILTQKDIEELSAGTQRVLALMRDGRWHTADEIELVAGVDGVPAREGLRRMRELRAWHQIERQRVGEGRQFSYRLVVQKREVPKWWRGE